MSQPEINAGINDRSLDYTVFVTGSTNGIGRETALALARLGCDLYVHGRDTQKGHEVVEQIENTGASARFFEADLANQDEVRELADEVKNTSEGQDGLDVLINNAGGYFRNKGKTQDGIEYTFAVNHLSHFIITRKLLPTLSNSDVGEILNVSSSAHRRGDMNLSSIEGENVDSGVSAYGRSKLANIHFTKCLDRKLEQNNIEVSVNAVHPGGIPSSGFLRSLPTPIYKIGRKIGKIPLFDQPEDGATTILYTLFSDDTTGESGNYYKDTEKSKPNKIARNRKKQEELWNKSVELSNTDWSKLF